MVDILVKAIAERGTVEALYKSGLTGRQNLAQG
jgi:hypothetical protein